MIIVIEDNKDCREAIIAFLENHSYDAIGLECIENAFDFLGSCAENIFCILLDLHLSRGLTGREGVAALLSAAPKTPVVILTGDTSDEARAIERETSCPVLAKPTHPSAIVSLLAEIKAGLYLR